MFSLSLWLKIWAIANRRKSLSSPDNALSGIGYSKNQEFSKIQSFWQKMDKVRVQKLSKAILRQIRTLNWSVWEQA
jgi:hypothetical protein